MKSTPLLRQLFAVVLITTFISLACRKNDWRLQVDNQDKQNEALFFNAYSPNSPAAQAVLHFTKNQNAQYHFAAHYLEQIGKPRWDKALVFESKNAARTADAAVDSTVVYIPFVRDAQQYVNASLIVNMKPGDTTFRMLYDWEYKNFGFEQPQGAGWNASSMMQVYMQMDRQVFGTEQYLVKDAQLLPTTTTDYIKANQWPLDSIEVIASITTDMARQPVEASAMIQSYCVTIIYCVQSPKVLKAFRGAVQPMSTSGDGSCTSNTQCYISYPDFGGGGGGTGNPGGSGGGGSGGGSGSGSGGWTNPNPAPVDCSTQTSYAIGKDNPCPRGWEPVPKVVQNNVNDPCLKKMVDNIINKNLNNKITNFVNSVFANSDRFDLHFFDGTLIGQQSQIDAYTKTDISSPGVLRSVIKLNTLQLQKASEEYIAATIIHELIHAWIDHNYPVSQPNNREQHELMANTCRFNLMKDILRSMYTNITEQEASDLTWGGLYSTIKFNNLSISDRERIGTTNSLFKNGSKGIVCTP